MRRLMALFAVIGLLGIAVTSASWGADAQSDDGDLRTQVADLQARVAVLETRVAGESAATPAASTKLLMGTVLLISGGRGEEVQREGGFAVGEPCSGKGGYTDLRAGGPVIVADESGIVIATGEITGGFLTEDYSCLFGFVVAGIPDAAFYSVKVGNRPPLIYSRAELGAVDWWLNLTLG